MQNMNERNIKAMTIVATGLISDLRTENGSRLVESSKGGAFYIVTGYSCTCPDAKYREATCKHQIAVRLSNVLDAAEIENGEVAA